ncbi:MAG: outer membrane protein assembly factor BamE [Pseudomonadota bacterium]
MQVKRGARRLSFLGLVLVLGACSATYRTHGYVPTDQQLDEIIVGLDTRASVEDQLGAPSTSGVESESGFFYLSETRRQLGAFAPEITDRQLVAIRFDPEGLVENVERFTLEDGRVVPLSRRVTQSNVRDTTFIRQLLGNIGRFDPGRLLGGDS